MLGSTAITIEQQQQQYQQTVGCQLWGLTRKHSESADLLQVESSSPPLIQLVIWIPFIITSPKEICFCWHLSVANIAQKLE